jgi:hypothetical protein
VIRDLIILTTDAREVVKRVQGVYSSTPAHAKFLHSRDLLCKTYTEGNKQGNKQEHSSAKVQMK